MLDNNLINIYSDRDKIRNEIIEYMKDYLELDNIDLSKTSYLSFLINVISALTSNLVFYSSSVYQEFFLTKAIQRESILNWAAMLGYTPPLATPSVGQVLVSIPMTFSSDTTIVIPKNFIYKANNIIFQQNNEVRIVLLQNETFSWVATVTETLDVGGTRSLAFQFNSDKSLLNFVVGVTQESTNVLEFTVPRLNPYEFYKLDVAFSGSLSDIEVYTVKEGSDQRTKWTQYESLFLIPAKYPGFAYRSIEGGISLFFGNEIIGRQPDYGDKIEVYINTTLGASGNVISGSITKPDRLYTLEDLDSPTPIPSKPVNIECVNTSPSTGGTDSLSVDQIRSLSMANVAASKRLVSAWDYQNIDNIVDDLPVQHATYVMKRSDIKNNEITLFTDIIFQDIIVPTRNTSWELDATSNYKIYNQDVITIDDEEYYSLFNIDVDPIVKESEYYYIIKDTDASVTLNRTYSETTELLPTYARFNVIEYVNPLNNILRITLFYQQIETGDYSGTECLLSTSFDSAYQEMTHDYSNKKYTIDLSLSTVPDDSQIFYFSMRKDSTEYYCDSQVEVVVKRDLNEFMYSQVAYDSTSEVAVVYDVPVIKKDYFDSIDSNTFTLQVLQKIILFDVMDYRMLTDFLNLKFSNTTGQLSNMNYNSTTKADTLSLNPTELPISPSNGDRYVVTNKNNPWDKTPSFVAVYNGISGQWGYDYLKINDVIYILSEDKKFLFNGDKLVEMDDLTIPFELDVIVWKSQNISMDSQTLVRGVKDALIDTFYNKFGYDKPIYRSEIIKTIQSVTGVEHCELRYPTHDIFFDYDITKDLTQEQLLLYSPQLVYFDTSTISVEVR